METGAVYIAVLLQLLDLLEKDPFFSFCWTNWKKTLSFFIIRCWKTGIPGFFKLEL